MRRGEQRERRRQAGRGQARRASNEMRSFQIDHVMNHILTLREGERRVQVTVSRFTVVSRQKKVENVTGQSSTVNAAEERGPNIELCCVDLGT